MAEPSDGPGQRFGDLLIYHRRAAGLTQEALAELARISVVTIGALERGVRRAPYRETVARLIAALGLMSPQSDEFARAADAERRRAARPTSPRPQRHDNLPATITSFVGRSVNVAELADLIRARRLVTVTGAGGIGKTRLAVEVASQCRTEFRDGVRLVDLASVTDCDGAIEKAVGTLGGPIARHGEPIEDLVATLGTRRMLLIFDSCEHIVAAIGRLAAAILRGCPDVSILATSRERLKIKGETSYRVQPLSLPPANGRRTAAELHAYDAPALFSDRASTVDPNFRLSDRNTAAVYAICHRLDGIPLAIELAAARLSTLSITELELRLRAHFGILCDGERDAPTRHQTLISTIEWSCNLLTASERSLLGRLVVFSGSWTLEAAEFVCGDDCLCERSVLDALSSLVDKSLVFVEPASTESKRFHMHQSTRSYARDALTLETERTLLATRHLEYYRRLFGSAGEAFLRTARSQPIVDLKIELPNVRAALTCALANDVAAGADLFSTTPFWHFCELHHDAIALAEEFLAMLGERDARLQALLWTRLSVAAASLGLTGRAFEAGSNAVRAARRTDDRAMLALLLSRFAFLAARERHLAEAEATLREVEHIYAEAATSSSITLVHRNSYWEAAGRLAMQRDDKHAAARAYDWLRRMHRDLENERSELLMQLLLAEVEHTRGNSERALVLLQSMLPRAHSLAERDIYSCTLEVLTAALIATNRRAEALSAGREAIALCVEQSRAEWIPYTMEHLALALLLDGEIVVAALLAGFCESAIRRLGGSRESSAAITYDRLTALLAEQLSPQRLARLHARGAELTQHRAIALAAEGSGGGDGDADHFDGTVFE